MSSQKRSLARRSLTGEPEQQQQVLTAAVAHAEGVQYPPGFETSRRASAAHLRKKLNASSVDEELGDSSGSGEDEGGEDPHAPDVAGETTADAAAAAAIGQQPLSAVTSTTAAAADDSATALSGDQELAPSVRRMSLDDKNVATEMAMAAAAAAAAAAASVSAQAAATASASASSNSPSPSDGPKPARAERR